jgi:hypothetical protein
MAAMTWPHAIPPQRRTKGQLPRVGSPTSRFSPPCHTTAAQDKGSELPHACSVENTPRKRQTPRGLHSQDDERSPQQRADTSTPAAAISLMMREPVLISRDANPPLRYAEPCPSILLLAFAWSKLMGVIGNASLTACPAPTHLPHSPREGAGSSRAAERGD